MDALYDGLTTSTTTGQILLQSLATGTRDTDTDTGNGVSYRHRPQCIANNPTTTSPCTTSYQSTKWTEHGTQTGISFNNGLR